MLEVIILAGGKGTRLQSVVSDVPKPMAPVGDYPFLYYLLTYLKGEGVERFILSIGYKADSVIDYFGDSFQGIPIQYSVEDTPMGTGGGIRAALQLAQSNDVLVVNGDTFFPVPIQKLQYVHQLRQSDYTIALHPVDSNGRYGGVEVNALGRITGFTARDKLGNIAINAGIYLIKRSNFLENTPTDKAFSVEDDFLKELPESTQFQAVEYSNHYFIDIGIPADYQRAQTDIPNLFSGTRKRFLFLDRDGVINVKIEADYVRELTDWVWHEGSLSTLSTINAYFDRLIIVTNQRGVGRGIMSVDSLARIHAYFDDQVKAQGGNIDAIFFCPDTEDSSPNRKPNIGMLLQAQQRFPEIVFSESIMVGDSKSDMSMGKKAGMNTVFIANNQVPDYNTLSLSDEIHVSLSAWFMHFTATIKRSDQETR